MPWINPIELLQLENYELEEINEEVIVEALRRLRGEENEQPVIYRKHTLSEEQLSEVIREFDDPTRINYYHRLCAYPELNSFLAGDPFARAEEAGLQDELITDTAARQLQPLYDEYLRQALEKERASELAAFVGQVEKGSESFQSIVFQGKSSNYLEERLATVRRMAEKLEQGTEEEAQLAVGKLRFLREQVSADALNALPQRFAGIRNAFAEALLRMAERLSNQNPSLALGIARHARRLRTDKEVGKRLNELYWQLERRVESAVPESTGQPSQKWVPWAWAGILAMLVLLGAFLVSQFYDDAVNLLSGLANSLEEQTNEYSIDNGGQEQPTDDALKALAERLASQGSISREELDRILSESGGSTQLTEVNLLLQIPWQERGSAYSEELPGEVTAGGAPMAICFPPQPTNAGPAPAFTVIGDPVYDALVFFFNGRTYFQQAFIPAKSKLKIEKALNEEQVVSTMLIFGQEWSPEVESPCGTPGYFTKNIFYGGFAAYATDPPTLNLHRDDFLQLKKNRLMPSRQLEEEKFFDLLERYR